MEAVRECSPWLVGRDDDWLSVVDWLSAAGYCRLSCTLTIPTGGLLVPPPPGISKWFLRLACGHGEPVMTAIGHRYNTGACWPPITVSREPRQGPAWHQDSKQSLAPNPGIKASHQSLASKPGTKAWHQDSRQSQGVLRGWEAAQNNNNISSQRARLLEGMCWSLGVCEKVNFRVSHGN